MKEPYSTPKSGLGNVFSRDTKRKCTTSGVLTSHLHCSQQAQEQTFQLITEQFLQTADLHWFLMQTTCRLVTMSVLEPETQVSAIFQTHWKKENTMPLCISDMWLQHLPEILQSSPWQRSKLWSQILLKASRGQRELQHGYSNHILSINQAH